MATQTVQLFNESWNERFVSNLIFTIYDDYMQIYKREFIQEYNQEYN